MFGLHGLALGGLASVWPRWRPRSGSCSSKEECRTSTSRCPRLHEIPRLLTGTPWLAGIAAMVLGQILSAVALGLGDLALVEPTNAAEVLFALLIVAS